MCSKTWKNFLRNHWIENCEERDGWNERNLSMEEYEELNKSWLSEKFEKNGVKNEDK